jgi:hypothetical protein
MEELWPCLATLGWTALPLPQALVHRHPHTGNPVLPVRRSWSPLAAVTLPLASWRLACACGLRRLGSHVECLCRTRGTHHDREG